jgi:hypothetical protein
MFANKCVILVVTAVLAATVFGAVLLPRPEAQQPIIRTAKPSTVPILSAPLVSVKVWDRPTIHTGTNASKQEGGGSVDLYDNFIIVTRMNGERTVVRNEHYSELVFK